MIRISDVPRFGIRHLDRERTPGAPFVGEAFPGAAVARLQNPPPNLAKQAPIPNQRAKERRARPVLIAAILIGFGVANMGCGGEGGNGARRGKSNSQGTRAAAESLEARGAAREALKEFRDASRRYPMEAWAWEGLGRTALRLGRDEEAESALTTAVRRDPSRASVHRELAQLHFDRGALNPALTEVDDALRLAGDDPELLALRARILVGDGRLVEAETMLARAEAMAPSHIAVRAARIFVAIASDSLTRALDDANALVRVAPADPRALEARAATLERAGDPRGALADLKKALEADARRPRARHDLARLLLETGDAAGSERENRFLLDDHPSDARALEGLGAATLARGDPEGAERAFRDAMETAPDAAPAYLALGRFLASQSRLEEAIEVLRKARARAALETARWEDCSVELASAHLELGEAGNALEISESVLARIPESRKGRAIRARALAAGGGGNDAAAALERLATRSNATREEVFAYADWLLARGDAERALDAVDAFAARDSSATDADALVKRAEALGALGRDADAEAAWNAALERRPGDASALLGLAGARLRAGRTAEAESLALRGERDHPHDARFPTLAGETALHAGRLAAADSALGRALDADARAWRAGILRALLEDRAGRTQEAMRRLETILERNERSSDAHAALAWILADREIDADLAETHARRAIELAPAESFGRAALAWALLKRGRSDDALAAADEAKDAGPRDARVAYVRGCVLQSLDREREARLEFRRALDLAPAFDHADDARTRLLNF